MSFLEASAKERELLAAAAAEERAIERLQKYQAEIMETLVGQANVVAVPYGVSASWYELSSDKSQVAQLLRQLKQERRDRTAIQFALRESQDAHARSAAFLNQARNQVAVMRELLSHVSTKDALMLGKLEEGFATCHNLTATNQTSFGPASGGVRSSRTGYLFGGPKL